eukprot:5488152-Lingulodinium_polyedra.AAC.1
MGAAPTDGDEAGARGCGVAHVVAAANAARWNSANKLANCSTSCGNLPTKYCSDTCPTSARWPSPSLPSATAL